MKMVVAAQAYQNLWFEFKNRTVATVVVETASFLVEAVVALFGNLLVCYAVYKNPRLRSPTNYYIVSLALSDVLQVFFSMQLSIGMLATGRWPFTEAACYFSCWSKFALASVSLSTMTLMAANRYLKIVIPGKYPSLFKGKVILGSAVCAWISSSLDSLLITFGLGLKPKIDPGSVNCAPEVHVFLFPVICLVLYGPFIFIFVFYFKIYKAVKVHKSNVSWQSANVEDLKISKTLFATVVGFASIWVPVGVIYGHSVIRGIFDFPRVALLIKTCLIYLSSCVNPFIYGVMNRAFRREFKRFLRLRPIRTNKVAVTG